MTAPSFGVGIDATGGQTTVLRTTIANGMTDGIVTTGALVVDSSSITDHAEVGIYAGGSLTLQRSLVRMNRGGGVSATGMYDITNSFILRNGNDGDGQFGGMRLYSTAGSNRVEHNTIVRNDTIVGTMFAGGLHCNTVNARNNIICNNFEGNTTQPHAQTNGSCSFASSHVTPDCANIQFVGGTDDDHHLASGSTGAIGAGVPSEVIDDFDADVRPNGMPDLGADEFY